MTTISPRGPRLAKWPIFFAGLIALFFLAQASAAVAANKKLRDFTPSEVSKLSPLGRLASTQKLNLAIGLPLRNQAALTQFLKDLNDPTSPNYRHYLTPAQFTEQYGPTAADYAAVVAFAKAKGLTVMSVHPNRMILDVQANTPTVEKAFGVQMMSYQHPSEARKFYAPNGAPTVDTNLPILDINGLNNYSLPQPHYKLLKKNLLPAAQAKANAGIVTGHSYGAAPAPNVGSGPSSAYMGSDFRNAYAPGVSQTGTGQTVGLLQFDGYTTSDITYYESLAGLPNVPLTNVLLDGFSGAPTGSGGEVEVSLDIEMSMSMAPNLSGIIVYMAGPSGNWHDILNRMCTDNLASQLSCSWYIPSGASDPTADQIFEEMSAQGESFFSASGDADAYTGLIPFPDDSPYITLVGGTMLTMNGTGSSYASEAAWNRNNNVGTGGGVSTQYPIPTWQQGVSMSSNLGSTTMRNVPDVALTAENVYVRADGEDQEVGGTSCASPLWAGFMALVNQQATSNSGKSVGFINPAVYAIGSGGSYTNDFHDTTTGNNFSTSSPAKFPAVTGYDLATGWGSPTGSAMITALAGSSTPTISTTSPLASAVAGSNYSQTFAASGGTSPYTWAITGTTTPPGLNMSASGVLSGILSSSGTVTFTVQVTDANNHFSSSPFSLTIYPAGTPVIASTSPLPSGNATVAYTDTLTATGGTPPLSWSLASGSLPTGLSLSTSGVISGTPTTTGGVSFTVQVTDNNGLSSTALLSLTINAAPAPPTITTLSPLPAAKTGAAYSATLTATGGTTPYTWSLASGSLPPGMILNPLGVITGTTTIANTYSFSVRATGGNGLFSVAPYFLNVSPQGTLIPNGSFETDSLVDWVDLDGPGPFVTQQVVGNGVSPGFGLFSTAATDGSFSAVNGFDCSGPGTIRLAQDIAITSANSFLTFDYRAGWDMKDYAGSTQARTFAVTIEPAGGGATEATFLQLTAQPQTVTLDTGSQSGTVNLSAYIGTTIRVCFDCVIPEYHTGPGFFELDNVRLGSTASLIITTNNPLPNGAVGSIYSQTLAATGGTAPYTWHPIAGTFPPGVSLSTTGTLSGVAQTQGNYAFEVLAISATGTSTTKAFGVTINPPAAPPTITTPSTLPSGTVGVAYSQALAATGGTTPYTWSVLSGSLPSGLTLSSSSVISGTPTSIGDPSFLVQVAGANGASGVRSFSLATVGGTLNHFAWSTINSPQSVGTPFSATITAQDAGNNTITSFTGTVSLSAGATQNILNSPVPTSSFNNNTWTIGYSFTPSTNLTVTGVRSYSGTKVSIWTDTGTLLTSAAVTATPGSWTDTPLATPVILQAGTTYRVGFLTGGQLYYWRTDMGSTFANGTLVQDYESVGDTFPTSADGDRWIFVDLDYVVGSSTSETITPSSTGNFVSGVWTGNITAGQPATGISILANDGAGHSGTSNAFNVTAAANLSVSPTTGLTTSGPVGGPFSPSGTYTLSNLGTGTMTWSAGVGQPWMSLTASTGTLGPGGSAQVAAFVNANAAPFGVGAYTDTLTFTNTTSGFGNTSLPITLNVLPPAPVITGTLTASGAVGQAFSYQIAGSNSPTSFSASGLPSGLSVSTSSGAITGSPTIGGVTNVTIGATNAGGTGTATLVITILQVPTITNGPPPAVTYNAPYSFTFAASGYPAPTYALTAGSLPSGLTLSTAGVISGTTTATGSYPGTVTATNSTGTSTQSFTLVVQQAPVITNSPPSGALQNTPYNFAYTFQGFPTPTFSLTSGALPTGLNISSAGVISGTPTASGTFTGVITASNGVSPSATQNFSITVQLVPAPPAITNGPPPATAPVNTPYAFAYTSTGSPSPSFTLSGGALPTGLTLSSTGVISGTPTVVGTFTGTVMAGNASGSVTQNFSISILSNLVQQYTVLHNFNDGTVTNDGISPIGSLLQANDGNFWGATYYGGTNGYGVMYKMTPTGSITIENICANGSSEGMYPKDGMIQGTDGNFYMTTSSGGPTINGAVLKITLQGVTSEVYGFNSNPTGYQTAASVVQWTDGSLYTVAPVGGSANDGTVFKVTLTGSLTVLHNFQDGSVANDGTAPTTQLILASDGNFYGTTGGGGSAAAGVIYKMSSTGSTTILHSFGDGTVTNDGRDPQAALLQGSDGNFYGTTDAGGTTGFGTIFKMTPTGSVTILHNFRDGSVSGDGENPQAPLIQGTDGNLYGTTSYGGTAGFGAIYRTTTQGNVSLVHSFADGSVINDGKETTSPITQGTDGNLYGVTYGGGTTGEGVAFKVVLATATPTAPAFVNQPLVASTLISTAYSFTYSTTGFPGATLQVTSGALPPGLNLSSGGSITGTSTAAGAFTGIVTASNGVGSPATQSFSITVDQPPAFTDGPPPSGMVGGAYNFAYTASGTPVPTFSVTSGALPTGLSLSTVGAISGTPTTSGTYTGIVTATNGEGTAATQNFSIAIASLAAPVPTPEPPTTLGSSNTVSWASIIGAVQYEVQASTSPNFSNVIDSGWITGTSFTFTNLSFGTTYYFRVRAETSSTPDGTWSQTTETAFNADTLTNVVAETGNLFIADSNNDTIREITAGNSVSTFAGTAGVTGSLDAKGTAARFDYTTGGAFDAAGNLYIADSTNNTVRKIASDGTTSTFAGLAGSQGSTDGKGSVARFNTPYGMAFDSTGNMYVADRNNYTIRKIAPDGTVSTFAGLAGVTGTTDGVGSSARFNWPAFPAVDRSNNVYIADQSNSTIRKITPTGTVTTLAGTPGVFSSGDGVGSAAKFNNPSSLAVDASGNVYVTDNGNSTIRKITPTGTVTTFAGVAGSTGSTDGTGSGARFNHPNGIAVDGSGNIYVSDDNNFIIRKITPAAVVTTLAGSALSSGSTDGNGSTARFSNPQGVAINDIGGMVLATTGTVYATSGTIISTVIAPSTLQQWNVLSYTDNVSGSGTGVTVDVLDSNGSLLAAAVPSGTDLSTLPAVAAASSIELRANLSTSNTANTPIFEGWSVAYFASVFSAWSSTISSTQTQPVAPMITSTAPPSGIVGTAYNFPYTATGNPAPTFALTAGNLPPGLTLATSGALAGSPTTSGIYTGTVTASNGVSPVATQAFNITIQSTFSSWAAQYFTVQQMGDPTVSGSNATPQNDGITNLLKYVYDINPSRTMTAADMAALPVGSMTTISGQKYLCLTYRQNALLSGYTIHLQSSPDLHNWTTVTPDLSQQTGIDPVTGDPIMQVGINVTNLGQAFLRLDITSP